MSSQYPFCKSCHRCRSPPLSQWPHFRWEVHPIFVCLPHKHVDGLKPLVLPPIFSTSVFLKAGFCTINHKKTSKTRKIKEDLINNFLEATMVPLNTSVGSNVHRPSKWPCVINRHFPYRTVTVTSLSKVVKHALENPILTFLASCLPIWALFLKDILHTPIPASLLNQALT